MKGEGYEPLRTVSVWFAGEKNLAKAAWEKTGKGEIWLPKVKNLILVTESVTKSEKTDFGNGIGYQFSGFQILVTVVRSG